MTDRDKVIRGLERCRKRTCTTIFFSKEYEECEYTTGMYCNQDKLFDEAIEILKNCPGLTRIEIEGSERSWWHVCGECHGQISRPDLYCRHCGRRIIWDEIQRTAAE